jgi:hypothetical protein
MMLQDDGSLAPELLNGEFVRAVRVAALSNLAEGASLRQSSPTEAFELISSAYRLHANANAIEWLSARYIQLGQDAEYWGRFAESAEDFVTEIVSRFSRPQ